MTLSRILIPEVKRDLETEDILIVENLVKTYGELKAVNDISFSVRKGSLFAFLGLNGAGKSTTINIICSILGKDSGKIYVDGFDIDKKAMESFTQETYAIFGKVYQQQQGNGGDQNQQGGPQAGSTSDDGTVESSFTE